MTSEIKVGIIFSLGVFILFVMTVIVTGFSFFAAGYTFPVYFTNIGGLEEGGRVLYLGVNVGKVEEVTVRDSMVRVLIRIEDNKIFIPSDSDVTIEQSNLLAGMQVSISGGKSSRPIQDDRLKRGTDPAPFTQALSDAAVAAEKAIEGIRNPLAETIENIEDITRGIKDGPGVAHDLINESEIHDNIRVATEKLRNVLAEIDEGKGTVGKLLKDETVYDRLSATLEEAEKALAGIRQIVDSANKGEGTLGKLIKDDEVYDNVRDITRDLKSVSATVKNGLEGQGLLARLFSDESAELYTDIKDTAAGAKELLNRLNTGQGTLGKLFTSDEIYDDVKAITGNVRTATEKLTTKDSTIGKLFNESTLYDKAEKTIDDLDETLGAAARMRVFVHLSFYSSNHPYQQYRSQIQLKVWPRSTRYFLIGATFIDVGDAAPLIRIDPDYQRKGKYIFNADFQLAWVLKLGSNEKAEKKESENDDDSENDEKGKLMPEDSKKLTLRVGLLEGLTGGGFDLDFWHRFRLTGELRARHRSEGDYYEDIEPYYARAYLSMKVAKFFRVYAGADNLADKAVMSFGISIEWEDKDIKNIIGIAGSAF